MIHSDTFWRTVVSGFIATYVMSMIAFTQGGIGLPVLDIGHFLTESFNYMHDDNPYSILWGNAAYFIMGIILAFVWVVFLNHRIPGNWFVQAIIYGAIISVIAGLIVSPLVSLSAGESFGLFYSDTWAPGIILLAGLTIHLGYAITLMLCLRVAGVKGLHIED